MTMEPTTATRRAIDAATFAEAFRITAGSHPDRVAVRTKDGDVSWTWGELRDRVDALAGGLAGLGLRRGDTLAIMLSNRPEFHLVDLAAMMVGATPFSLYQTSSPDQIEYVVGDAEARIVITEPAYLDQVLASQRALGEQIEHVVLVEGEGEGCLRLDEVEGSDPEFDVDASVAAIQPDDVLTLIYTSGTTGPPKGVQLAHRNLL